MRMNVLLFILTRPVGETALLSRVEAPLNCPLIISQKRGVNLLGLFI